MNKLHRFLTVVNALKVYFDYHFYCALDLLTQAMQLNISKDYLRQIYNFSYHDIMANDVTQLLETYGTCKSALLQNERRLRPLWQLPHAQKHGY